MTVPNIVLVSERPADTYPQGWGRYESLAQLLATQSAADVVVLDLPIASLHEGLILLRGDERYRIAHVYTVEEGSRIHPLSDGMLPGNMSDITSAHIRLQARLAAFNRGVPPATLEEYVLAWFWTRQQAELLPLRDSANAQIYKYPLLMAFAGQEQINEPLWLRLMEEQGLLMPVRLIDRIRLCGHCSGGHLNYVDVCPSCNELDITRQPALHCFTCGHVAPQEHFIKEGLLLCPNCLSKLRHIGSDYDRPLENQTCQSCRTSFVDADVEARCLDCGQAQQPDELRIRQLYTYRLTDKARMRCRQGLNESLVDSYFNRLGLINLDNFTRLLEWQLQQALRYQQTPPCSVLGLHLEGLEQLLDTSAGQATLDGLIERIEQTVREADRCSRARDNLLWFLLPHTDRAGAEVLVRRMQGLTDLLDLHSDTVTLTVTTCTLPYDIEKDETASLLLARLTGEIC
ncbi:MAG: diguanylate cyclase [Thiopseudomonas sp.]